MTKAIKKAKPAKFDANAWSRANRDTATRADGAQPGDFQGTLPLDTSRFAIWRQRGAYKPARLFEIVGETAGRAFGFVLECNGWYKGTREGVYHRNYGAKGDTSGTFRRNLVAGYAALEVRLLAHEITVDLDKLRGAVVRGYRSALYYGVDFATRKDKTVIAVLDTQTGKLVGLKDETES